MGSKPTKATTPATKTSKAKNGKPFCTKTLDAARQKQRETILAANTKYIANVLPHLDLMRAHALDDTSPSHQLTGRNFLLVTIPQIVECYDKHYRNGKAPTFSDGRPILNTTEMASYSSTIEVFREFYNATLSKHEAKYGTFTSKMITDVKNRGKKQQKERKEQTLKATLPMKLSKAHSFKDIEQIAVELRHSILKVEIQLRKLHSGMPISQELYRLFPSLFTAPQINNLQRSSTPAKITQASQYFEKQLTVLRANVKQVENKLEKIEPNSKLWKEQCPTLVSSVLPWRVGVVEGNICPLLGEMRCERALKKLCLGKVYGGKTDDSHEHKLLVLEYYAEELVLAEAKYGMIRNTGCCHHEHGWGEPVPVSAAILDGCRRSGFEQKCKDKCQALVVLVEELKMSSSALDASMEKLKELHDGMDLVGTKKREEKVGEEKVGEEKTAMALVPSAPSFDFLDMPEAVGVVVGDDAAGIDVVASLESFLPLAPSFPLPDLSGLELEAALPVAPTHSVGLAEVNVTEEERTPTALA